MTIGVPHVTHLARDAAELWFLVLFFKILFMYLREREREREQHPQGEREKHTAH